MRRHASSALLLALGLLLATALPAAAHPRVEQAQVPASATQGLTLVVPGEREGSLTSSVEVLLPAELTDATCDRVDGWSCEVEDDGEAGSTVLRFQRDADGDAEAPLRFSATTPDEPQVLHLPTIQVYDDGTEVAWLQTGDDAERPAPTLEVVAAGATVTTATEGPDTTHGDPAAAASPTTDEPSAGATATPDTGETDEAVEGEAVQTGSSSPVLAIILALVALGGVIAVFVRRRMASRR